MASTPQIGDRAPDFALEGTDGAAIVVDEDGTVRYRHVHMLGMDFQDVDALHDALDSLPART
jgi:hypothetical protein